MKPYCKRENETNDVPPVETTKENETDDVSQENVPQDLRKSKRTPVNDSPVQSSRPSSDPESAGDVYPRSSTILLPPQGLTVLNRIFQSNLITE